MIRRVEAIMEDLVPLNEQQREVKRELETVHAATEFLLGQWLKGDPVPVSATEQFLRSRFGFAELTEEEGES